MNDNLKDAASGLNTGALALAIYDQFCKDTESATPDVRLDLFLGVAAHVTAILITTAVDEGIKDGGPKQGSLARVLRGAEVAGDSFSFRLANGLGGALLETIAEHRKEKGK